MDSREKNELADYFNYNVNDNYILNPSIFRDLAVTRALKAQYTTNWID